MEITLLINEEEKKFGTGFISARMFRRAISMRKKMSEDMSEEDLDEVVDYVADIFGGKFTRDQLYDGLESDKLIPTIIDCINQVIGKVNKVVAPGADPNVVTKG